MASSSEATIGSNLTSLDKLIAKYTEMGTGYKTTNNPTITIHHNL